ncbi:MAG: hypothetical protein ORO03_05145 [Alphaproteobacteria bacterium]|nr:hypothetical protein [Alphaproteobacteria bacterium]
MRDCAFGAAQSLAVTAEFANFLGNSVYNQMDYRSTILSSLQP